MGLLYRPHGPDLDMTVEAG